MKTLNISLKVAEKSVIYGIENFYSHSMCSAGGASINIYAEKWSVARWD